MDGTHAPLDPIAKATLLEQLTGGLLAHVQHQTAGSACATSPANDSP
ncbi:MAG: hypothetical protein LC739_05480 [Actinobacteria bacterium]|nr:hypothetical protein [Actinomycetota bacterium]